MFFHVFEEGKSCLLRKDFFFSWLKKWKSTKLDCQSQILFVSYEKTLLEPFCRTPEWGTIRSQINFFSRSTEPVHAQDKLLDPKNSIHYIDDCSFHVLLKVAKTADSHAYYYWILEYGNMHCLFFCLVGRRFWRGMYTRFENGVHPRDNLHDIAAALSQHCTSLEDHVKLLQKVVYLLHWWVNEWLRGRFEIYLVFRFCT